MHAYDALRMRLQEGNLNYGECSLVGRKRSPVTRETAGSTPVIHPWIVTVDEFDREDYLEEVPGAGEK